MLGLFCWILPILDFGKKQEVSIICMADLVFSGMQMYFLYDRSSGFWVQIAEKQDNRNLVTLCT